MKDRIITVGTTDFVVRDGYVQELGTIKRWSPSHPQGWQEVMGRKVSLCSYATFGPDINQARELADRWCAKARKAWEAASA